jgi:hypothetical protein
MALPPLYKYLNVEGAKLTLGNRTFNMPSPRISTIPKI